MKRVALSCLAAALAGCAHDEPGQTIVVHPSPVVLEARGASSSVITRESVRAEPSRIQVVPSKRPDRPAEVVGVVDAHVPMGDHDRALAVLREKAAALGADAVIGVDFAHGEGHGGQPIHLSGLAIRYLERPLGAD